MSLVNGTATRQGILEEAIFEVWLNAVPVLVESLLFGVFSLLFACSTYLLVKRGLGRYPNAFMFGATLVIYCSSLVYLVVDFLFFNDTADDPYAHAQLHGNFIKRQSIVLTTCLGVNFLVTDAIVLWRAVVFWQGKKIIKYISLGLFIIAVAFGIADLATDTKLLGPWAYTLATARIPQSTMNGFGIVCISMSFLANIWATLLIGVKTWRYGTFVGKSANPSDASVLFLNLLKILTLSSLFYCLLWLVFMVTALLDTDTVSNAEETMLTYVNTQGIYPTLVVVLISMHAHVLDDSSMSDLHAAPVSDLTGTEICHYRTTVSA